MILSFMSILQGTGTNMKTYIDTLVVTMMTFALNAEGLSFGAGLSRAESEQDA